MERENKNLPTLKSYPNDLDGSGGCDNGLSFGPAMPLSVSPENEKEFVRSSLLCASVIVPLLVLIVVGASVLAWIITGVMVVVVDVIGTGICMLIDYLDDLDKEDYEIFVLYGSEDELPLHEKLGT